MFRNTTAVPNEAPEPTHSPGPFCPSACGDALIIQAERADPAPRPQRRQIVLEARAWRAPASLSHSQSRKLVLRCSPLADLDVALGFLFVPPEPCPRWLFRRPRR